MQSEARTVFVTGGARGIGRACAEKFLAEGWTVGVLDLDGQDHQRSAPKRRWIELTGDVTDAQEIKMAVDEFTRQAGPPTACLNAAGIYPMSTLESGNSDLYRRIFDVNVLGTFLTSQAATRAMPPGGAVVNFASINAFMPKVDQILYGAAKAAVVQLTKTMAAHLAPRQIRVNAVAPGPVDTEGLRAIPGRLEKIAATIPLGRAATVDEIADLVWWLVEASGSQYITGETIVTSGGLVMR